MLDHLVWMGYDVVMAELLVQLLNGPGVLVCVDSNSVQHLQCHSNGIFPTDSVLHVFQSHFVATVEHMQLVGDGFALGCGQWVVCSV